MAPQTIQLHPCPPSSQINCSECRLSGLCLPISLKLGDIERLNNIVKRYRPIQKDDRIYHSGDTFKSVYAISSGSVKTVNITQDGQEQITGFYLPGEIIGMDGIATNTHSNSSIALETSSMCEIPFSRLEELSTRVPSLQRRFFQIMSKEIVKDQQLITLLGKNSADQKLASFLLNLSARHLSRGLSSNDFTLTMSRSDIGNYLGLTIETVSRVMGRLHKNNIITLDKKHVKITDMTGLKALAFPAEEK